jgi:3-deoxy-D-manno-octulosonic acid kinase
VQALLFRIDAGQGQKHNGRVQTPINSQTVRQKSLLIVYDADAIPQPGRELFDPAYWKQRSLVVGEAIGRGSAIMLDADFGPAVLRQYLRGGWAAALSRDRYLFTGLQHSRPVREFRILEQMQQLNLPAPWPLAAMCLRSGASYTGALITRKIEQADTLADCLHGPMSAYPPDAGWGDIGACIRRFHDHGLVHADLNARNIMIRKDGKVFLIDFDRARIRKGADLACMSNLKRLQRSLNKLWPPGRSGNLDTCWQHLLTGYDKAIERPRPQKETKHVVENT